MKNEKVSSPRNNTNPRCHVCEDYNIELFPSYSNFKQVTSDCKPWKRGGKLALCRSCGCLQKLIDPLWLTDSNSIYNEYSIYYQGDGAEQKVFEKTSGTLTPRSLQIIDYVRKIIKLPDNGNYLDIGCGNGALLKHFHERYPKWKLFGIEVNGKYKDVVESIPSVQKMYVSHKPDVINESFNCITMVHVLEHIINPKEYLKKVHALLKSSGVLIIEVPNFEYNPYDLLVADHCTHFSEKTLSNLLHQTGFEILHTSNKCIPKEYTFIVRKASNFTPNFQFSDCNQISLFINRCLVWLEKNINDSIISAKNSKFGIFGTSIAGTWLYSEISEIVDFFIDEDPARNGTIHMGKTVYSLHDLPPQSVVFLPFCPEQAVGIKKRLEKIREDIKFIISGFRD